MASLIPDVDVSLWPRISVNVLRVRRDEAVHGQPEATESLEQQPRETRRLDDRARMIGPVISVVPSHAETVIVLEAPAKLGRSSPSATMR
jgi:hypothetical protein